MGNQKPRYVIGFEGGGNSARTLVEAMLQVNAVHITANWIIDDNIPPNVKICDVVNEIETGRKEYSVNIKLDEKSEKTTSALANPFRLMQFIELLNNAEANFELNVEPSSNLNFNNCNWLQFTLFMKKKMAEQSDHRFICLKLDGMHVATIDLVQQNYRRVESFMKIISGRNTLDFNLTNEYPENAQLDSVIPLSLENLLWLAGLIAGGGSPAPWLPDGPLYKLSRWPNFSILNHNMKMIEIAAKLTKAPMSIEQIADEVGVSKSIVCNFVNSVALLGLCQQASDSQQQLVSSSNVEKPASGNTTITQKRVSSLIGKFKQHLMKAG